MFAQKTVGTVFRKCFLFCFFVLLSYVNIGLIKKKQKQQLIKQFYLFKKAKDVFCKVKGWFDCWQASVS